jgi:NAD+ synthase
VPRRRPVGVARPAGPRYSPAMTDRSFRLALAQTSPLLGDVAGNAECVRAARGRAAAAGADLVLFPDGVLAGGAAGGLAHRPAFLDACRRACEDLARETADGGPALLLGLPWVEGGALYDAQALLDGGVIQAIRFKVRIGEAGASAFRPGPLPGPVPFRGLLRLGLVPGEDLADEEVPECLAETGAELLLACDAALYRRGGADRRLNRAVARVVETDLPLVWLNAVGAGMAGVCDGASFVLAADRSLTHQLPAFRETLIVTQWIRRDGVWISEPGEVAAIETGDEADYAACMLGLREHVRLTRSTGAVVELSSPACALSAALAVDALGPERVDAVLPAGGDPREVAAADDATAIAAALGLSARKIPMAGLIGALDVALPASGAQATPDRMDVARAALLTALARGMDRTLLAPSPRFGASGTAAVTGDLNPVGDLSPAEIGRLLELRRGWKPVGALGPDRLLLPALPVAPEEQPRDAILSALAAGQRIAEIVAAGHDAATVMALQEEQRSAADPRRAAPRIRLTESLDEAAVLHGFVDRGEPAYEPDATLVRGIGRPGADSIDF